MFLKSAFGVMLCVFLVYAGTAAESPKTRFVAAKPSAKVKRPGAWEKLLVYVLENGTDRSLKAPTSRTLGYDEDVVPTRAFRYKRGSAPDGKERAIHAIYRVDEGNKVLVNAVITSADITQADGKKHIDGYAFRLNPGGTLISAFRASGASGDVVQTPLDIASPATMKLLESEKQMLVNTMSGKDFDE